MYGVSFFAPSVMETPCMASLQIFVAGLPLHILEVILDILLFLLFNYKQDIIGLNYNIII